MKKKIIALHIDGYGIPDPPEEILSFLGNPIEMKHIPVHGGVDQLQEMIENHQDHADAIAINGFPEFLALGRRSKDYEPAQSIYDQAWKIPIVDGYDVLSAVERWSTQLSNDIEPGIWTNKKVLMLPGTNHVGLAESLQHYTREISYADEFLFLNDIERSGLNDLGSQGKRFDAILSAMATKPINQFQPNGLINHQLDKGLIQSAEFIAGDMGMVRKLSPGSLAGKSVVTTHCFPEDVQDLRNRGVSILITLLPNLSHDRRVFSRHSAAELEACLAISIPDGEERSENNYINLLTDLKWQPTIRYLQPHEAALNIFAYVSYPEHDEDFAQFKWMNWVPNRLLKGVTRHIPPVFLGQIKNFSRPDFKRKATGDAFWIGHSPQQLLQQEDEAVTRRVQRIAVMSEQLNARILGTSTSSREVVTALDTVKAKTDIGLASGQSYTILSAIEFAMQHVADLRDLADPKQAKAVVLQPEDVICSVAAEVLAGCVGHLTLIGSQPQPLLTLKKEIEEIHTKTEIIVSSSADKGLQQADIVVVGRSNNRFRRPIDISGIQPGAVICDFGQPAIISPAQAATRPDLLILETGMIHLPAPVEADFKFSYPPDYVPAALAEAALLAMEGRFSDFGLLSELESNHLYLIRDLAAKYNFATTGGWAFGYSIHVDHIPNKVALAKKLREDPHRLSSLNRSAEAALDLVEHSPTQNRRASRNNSLILAGLGVFALVAGIGGWIFSRRRNKEV